RYDHPVLVPRHSHKLAFFHLLLDGGYQGRHGPGEAPHLPFTVVFHPPRVEHKDDIGKNGAHFFSIEMDDSWLERLGGNRVSSVPLFDQHGGDLLWLSLQLYHEYRRLPNAFSGLAIEGLALELLATVVRGYDEASLSPGPRWFQRTFAQLHTGF